MFANTEALSPTRHKGLRFTQGTSYDFAKKINAVPVSAAEIFLACKYYPIVFTLKDPVRPLALLSLNRDENLFIDKKGNWSAPYVPAHIRRYPFILGGREGTDIFSIMIDRDAPHFSKRKGDPLFNKKGEPEEVVENAKKFLMEFHQQLVVTEKLLGEVAEKNLLEPQQFNVQKDGEKESYGGFRGVNEKKLQELDDKTAAKWVKNGVMGVLYAHLISMRNAQALIK